MRNGVPWRQTKGQTYLLRRRPAQLPGWFTPDGVNSQPSLLLFLGLWERREEKKGRQIAAAMILAAILLGAQRTAQSIKFSNSKADSLQHKLSYCSSVTKFLSSTSETETPSQYEITLGTSDSKLKDFNTVSVALSYKSTQV
jgi:hypothetical protein